jgi:two-component system CheB/CheR fusion protein
VFAGGRQIERRVRRTDRDTHYLMRILPYRDEAQTIDGALVTFVDVTEMVAAELRQRTLVEELNHRVRNMLTVVAAIASQTLRQTSSPAAFAEAFQGRIQSMGRSYTLVSREGWGHVLLADVLKAEFEVDRFVGRGRISLDGPAIWLAPSPALALGMAFHELTINALKYGALSQTKGRLSVAWTITGESLCIVWHEEGGPIPAEARRKGFGTTLVARQLDGPLNGSAAFDFTPEGLVVHMEMPIDGASIATDRPTEVEI